MEPISHSDNIDYQLLVNVLDGVATPAEAAEVEEWLKRSAANRDLYFKIKDILDYQRLSGQEVDTAAGWELVQVKMAAQKRRKRNVLMKYAAAAAVLLVLAGAWYFSKDRQPATGLQEVVRYAEAVQKATLPDGTNVWVNKGGSLRYRPDFGQQDREVWVTGTVYFEVAKGAQPFLVHADSVNVQVLGTSFTVQANRLEASVTVNSGKVKAGYGSEEMVVNPNERVLMAGRHMQKQRVNARLFSAWRDGEYFFEKTDIDELETVIRSNYGLEVTVKNKTKFKGSALSGQLKIEGEDALMLVLESTLDANVTIRQGKIIIQPK